ncbi:EAL domain-containing protein [Blastochloris sulfoviridis]|uniref:EAL domain-containing protein n=1 Tax=Blastochloris sulfoviridis TaxID=50712 RepID=A0A5M6I5U3_9HYPH|nr:EAL domain-containing protein [Blastochloris sulfoviridis]KAA5603148.1 EAL domain-containing protein [Blastochloris sulfoviridis]
MQRLGTLFIAFCMVMISGSLGALLYLVAGVPAAISGLAALTLLLGLAWWQFSALQTADRAHLGRQIGDLSSTVTDVARALADISRRVSDVDHRLQAIERRGTSIEAAAGEAARKAIHPLSAELVVLTGLVKDLAEATATHEQSLAVFEHNLQALAARPQVVMTPAAPAGAAAAAPEAEDVALAAPPAPVVRHGMLAGLSEADGLALAHRAVKAGRVEIYLQPIVTLPQRKVRYYEAMPRLRAEDGSLLTPDDYGDLARGGRLEPEIDLQVLLRCVQVVRRLASRNREIGLFLDLAADTLGDAEAMARYAEFLEANRALGPALVFQLAQEQFRLLGPVETEALAGVVDRGFKLALHRIQDLRFDARDLAERGVRFVKVPAVGLLDRSRAVGAEIHPADLGDLFSRHGIALVGDAIETEGQVVDLLDYDVKFGQGNLFAPPKPVRADVLGAERRPMRETVEAAPVPAPRVEIAAADVRREETRREDARRDEPAPRRTGGLADLAKTTIRRA